MIFVLLRGGGYMAWSRHPWMLRLLPSFVTYLRPVGVGCALLLGFERDYSPASLLAALLFVLSYWYLDLLDGWLARTLEAESRFVEVSELYVDRVCDKSICIYLILHRDGLVLPMVYLLVRLPGDAVLSGLKYPSDICRKLLAALELVQLHAPANKWLLRYAHVVRTLYFALALLDVSWIPVS